MMLMSQAAAAVDGVLHGTDVRFFDVSKDTRTIGEGALYVALSGQNFDGHAFIEAAGQAGAVGALVSRTDDSGMPQIEVEDTQVALGKLAAAWRDQFDGRVIAITGSNGKTTVKEMCRSILESEYGEAGVLSTWGNYNNEIGLPITLLGLREQHQVAVIEMGANHIGEIDYLTGLTRPDVAIITNAGDAHIGEFGSKDNIAKAKGEIFSGLGDNGVAVINTDDHYADYWVGLNSGHACMTFGIEQEAAVRASDITSDSFSLVTEEGEVHVDLSVPGRHNIMNALAAAAATLALGVSLGTVARGLSRYRGVSGRLSMMALEGERHLIDDTYNANPASMLAAIDVLVEDSDNGILVLGDMGELGNDAEIFHEEVGASARGAGVKQLFALGEMSVHSVRGFGEGAMHCSDMQSLVDAVISAFVPGSTVLVKGSRFMKMEQVVAMISDRYQGDVVA